MKVQWFLKDMDDIKNKHLEANANYWKYDLLLNAQRVLRELTGSKTLDFLNKHSDQVKNMMFMVEGKANIAMDDINNLVDYSVVTDEDGVTVFTLFVSDTYFSEHDTINKIGGRIARKYIARKKIGRQQMIDGFEREIRKLYTKDFYGKILEDDDHKLDVTGVFLR